MTRGQVRATMRRMRAHNEEAEEETGELNLVPYMDIVTNIIIFLLASVVNQIPLGNVNVTIPTLSQGGGPAENEDPEKPEAPPLNLTITVGGSGFTLAASGGVLPPIPKLPNGGYDFKGLTAKLVEIKNDPNNNAQGETKANFNADATIPYQTVVETLDAMREDEKGKMLFPDVSFAAGIL